MRTIVFFLLICVFITSTVQAECIYDAKSVSEPQLKSEHPKYSDWNNKDKEARFILTNNDFVYVKYWACDENGMQAQLVIPYYQGHLDALQDRIQWFGKHFLSKEDYAKLDEAMKVHGQIKFDDRLDVTNNRYAQFYLSTHSIEFTEIVTIVYYQN
jgi:hypothetical protein